MKSSNIPPLSRVPIFPPKLTATRHSSALENVNTFWDPYQGFKCFRKKVQKRVFRRIHNFSAHTISLLVKSLGLEPWRLDERRIRSPNSSRSSVTAQTFINYRQDMAKTHYTPISSLTLCSQNAECSCSGEQ